MSHENASDPDHHSDDHAHDELHMDPFYHPDYEGPIFDDFQTTGARWTDGGGVTSSLGGSGGTITWSLAGAGLSDSTGNNFFTGNTVALSSFLNYDFAAVIQDAFDQWSTYGDINFVQVADGGGNIGVGDTATIRILGGVIDGSSNVLARAFTPASSAAGGDIVFDSGDASFYANQDSFRLTAMHEIGHAIGLSHENSSSILALMNPMFNGNLSGLQPDDIAGIQAVYGSAGSVNPDLIATNVALSSTSAASGDVITVTYDITNDGDGVAANTSAGIYISTDNVITSNDTFITSELSDASNAVGAIDSESVAFSVPTLASGTYYIGVIADVNQDEPGESNESNNASPAPVAITITGIADDFGETAASAGQVSVNGSSMGNIQFSEDEDWFGVTLTTGTTYTINLEGSPTSSGTLADPYFRGIYDANGALISGTLDDDGGTGFNSMLTYTATYNGLHYLSAGAFGANQGTYTLSIDADAGPTEGVIQYDSAGGFIANHGTLQAAVDNGSSGDEFEVDPATYVANPESVLVDVGNAFFDLPTGITPTLTMAEIGITTLTLYGSGNATVIGNAANNFIDGNSGNNMLFGGLGNDDLFGNVGNDTLDGGSGGDILNGFTGFDTASYQSSVVGVTANLSNSAANTGDAAGDTYSFIEALLGSNFNDVLVSGTANNTLNAAGGDDLLFGGQGADIMRGGAGNDTMYVDQTGDVVVELFNEGEDRVFSSIDYTLGANVEGLTLFGPGNLNGTGNELVNSMVGNTENNVLNGLGGNDFLNGILGDDDLIGGQGNDLLFGGFNADTMTGGIGDDTYYVNEAGDTVIEGLNEGNDRVFSSVSHTLVTHVEGLTLFGAGNLNGTGNGSNNSIVGTGQNNILSGLQGNDILNGIAGDDTLIGGNGNDLLVGGGGADNFVFDTALATNNVDTIVDFAAGTDTIQLSNAIFAGIGASGEMNPFVFHAGASATTGSHRIIYDNGSLYYDADGSGAIAQELFATMLNAPIISNTDFEVI